MQSFLNKVTCVHGLLPIKVFKVKRFLGRGTIHSVYLCHVGTGLGFILGGHQLTKGTDCKCALHSVRLGLNSGPCLAWTSPLCNSTNDGTFRYPIISGKTALPGPAAEHLTNAWRQSFQPYSPGVIPRLRCAVCCPNLSACSC